MKSFKTGLMATTLFTGFLFVWATAGIIKDEPTEAPKKKTALKKTPLVKTKNLKDKTDKNLALQKKQKKALQERRKLQMESLKEFNAKQKKTVSSKIDKNKAISASTTTEKTAKTTTASTLTKRIQPASKKATKPLDKPASKFSEKKAAVQPQDNLSKQLVSKQADIEKELVQLALKNKLLNMQVTKQKGRVDEDMDNEITQNSNRMNLLQKQRDAIKILLQGDVAADNAGEEEIVEEDEIEEE